MMAEEKIKLAIFDFDGTLTTGHLWVGIARHHREKKINRFSLYTYFLSHMPFWLAAKARLYTDEKQRTKWGEDLPVLFKGFTKEEAADAFEWVTDNYFLPRLRPDVMQVLDEHRKQGDRVMILSGMFNEFLEVVGQKIGADFVIGTEMEYRDSRYSGRIVKPLCFGENKARFLVEYIRKKGLQVDFSRSTAYADSIYDLPVFQMVGNPVATYPDEELYQTAVSRQWKILGDRQK
jgi:HAD superfamily hydrolase (TIGR01490 family)